jgi:hypothetical protein
MMSRVVCATAIWCAVIAGGCGHPNSAGDSTRIELTNGSEAVALTAEQWASKPPLEWPQFVLTNDAEFIGHTPLRGASAFVIETADGRKLAATAKHLIGVDGGVEPAIPVARLDAVIRSWHLFPRTLPEKAFEADKLASRMLDDESLDWLLLTLKSNSQPLPATPLHLRPQPVQVGEEVYLVGCPYNEEACKQNVYLGKVTQRTGDRFRYDINPPVDLKGFSGAPVIDKRGHVVGVMTVWFEPKMQGEEYLEAGGEDSASVYGLVETRR